jgi:hypothetical protein
MEQNKTSKYFKYAIGEIVLVVIGILIALSINNWNEKRKEALQEISILKNLQTDLRTDIERISFQIDFKKDLIRDYLNCLEILAEKKEGTKEEIAQNLSSILQVGEVSLNKTTFNNLETTGEIRLIQNQALADSITAYYNSGYESWESALKDYTRNITAPYFLNFDYLAQLSLNLDGKEIKMPFKASEFKKPEKSLEDYKQNYFIINSLRQKTWNLEALVIQYQDLILYAQSIDRSIQNYLEKR